MRKRKAYLVAAAVIVTGLVFIANALFVRTAVVTPDGEGYLEIARQMASGEYWGKQSPELLFNTPSGIRTPLYPFLIYLSQIVFGASTASVLILHWILAALVTLISCLILRDKVVPEFTFIGMTLATILSSYLAVGILTEWTGFLGCIILYLILFKCFDSDSPKIRAILGFHCALLVLLKPVFLLATAVLLFLVQFKLSSWRLKNISILTFVAPLLIWASFNFYRQDSFSISPYGKFNLFGVAALSGSASVAPEDSYLEKEFITFTNQTKFPPLATEDEWMSQILKNYRQEKYDYNLWKVADKFRIQHDLSRPEINRLCGLYSWRAIKSNPINYLKYILAGMYFGWLGYLVSIGAVVLSILVYRRLPELQSLAAATLCASICHVLTITISAANITWLPRYEWMTRTPVIFALMVLIFATLENQAASKANSL